MSEKVQEERQTFTLNGVAYYSDTVTPDGNALISNIGIIDGEIDRAGLSLDVARIAKDSLVNKLESMVGEFEVVPVPEAEAETTTEG